MIKKIGDEIQKYAGRIINVVEQPVKLPNGKEVFFELARRSPGVRILIVCGDEIFLNKEYRSEIEEWDYRLPGGKVFDTLEEYLAAINSGVDIEKECLKAGVKELKEETGIVCSISDLEASYVSRLGATMSWDLHYFVLRLTSKPQLANEIKTDEGEHMMGQWFSFDEIKKLSLEGKIQEDRSLAFLFNFMLRED